MPNCQYVCGHCGTLKRSTKIYGSAVERLRRFPQCCEIPMQVLSFVQAEAATKLTAEQRVGWLEKGGHVFDRGGKHRWQPAVSPSHIEKALRQVTVHGRTLRKK